MITIQMLGPDDVIDPDDWCRPLNIISMNGGHSDYYSFRDQYSGSPENNAKWVKVKYIFGKAWHGSTVKFLDNELGDFVQYEFIRGNLPKRSILSLIDYNVTDHSKDSTEEDGLHYDDDIPF